MMKIYQFAICSEVYMVRRILIFFKIFFFTKYIFLLIHQSQIYLENEGNQYALLNVDFSLSKKSALIQKMF